MHRVLSPDTLAPPPRSAPRRTPACSPRASWFPSLLLLLLTLLPLTARETAEKPTRALPVPLLSLSPSAPPQSATPNAAPSHYRLAPNDILHIRVFQEEDLETSARVSKSGSIPFPLLGNVQLGGLTLQEATTRLESALREYLVRPQVAIRILEFNKRKFTVLGQVNRPGTFDFPDDSPLSLLEAIGMAGGYTRIANASKISLKRQTPNGEQIFRLNGKKMASDPDAPRFELQSGDTIVVEESLF